jgi:hypothetical protein
MRFLKAQLSSTESVLEPGHQRERILLRALNPEAVVIAVMTSFYRKGAAVNTAALS